MKPGLRVRGNGSIVGYVRRLRPLALLLLSRLRDLFLVCVTLRLGKDKIILFKIFKGLDFFFFFGWVKLVNWAYFVLNLLLVIFVVVLIFCACIFCFRF